MFIYQKNRGKLISCSTYLLEHSAEEPENGKDEVVRSEGVGNTDDDQRPLTEQKDRFTTECVGENREDQSSDHEAKDEDCLCEILEICAITDQIPLHNENTGNPLHRNTVYRASLGYDRPTVELAR